MLNHSKRKKNIIVGNNTAFYLLFAMLLSYSNFSYANNESFDGINCSDLPKTNAKEYKRKKQCFKYHREQKNKPNLNKLAKYKKEVIDAGLSEFKETPLVPFTESQKLMYPYRALGSLEITFSVKQSDGRLKNVTAACTAYLSGKNNVNTDGHCFDPKTLNVVKVKKAVISFNEKLDIQKHHFEINLETIKNGYNDDKNPQKWDWAQFTIDEPLGEKLGYFVLNYGDEIELQNGFTGSIPQPVGTNDPCMSTFNSKNIWEGPINNILNFNNEILSENPYRAHPIEVDLAKEKEFQFCSIGFTNHQKFELSISNCASIGIVDGTVISNCSARTGISGGPNFYGKTLYDNGKQVKAPITFAQNSSMHQPDNPDEYGELGPHVNSHSFLESRVPPFYDVNKQRYVSSIQNLLREDFAQKEHYTEGQSSSASK